MRLKIDHLCKIKHADIKVDGITVIAGENNTGKSTVGKVLFSIFNSMSEVEEKVKDQKIQQIYFECMDLVRGNYIRLNYLSPNFLKKMSVNIFDLFCGEKYPDRDEIIKEIRNSLDNDSIRIELDETELERRVEGIFTTIDLPDDRIMVEVVGRYFSRMFNNQVNSLTMPESQAEVELEVKDKKISLLFSDNRCIGYKDQISLRNKAIYIDNPFIVDNDNFSNYTDLSVTDDFLRNMLADMNSADIEDGVISSVLAKAKLETVYNLLGAVTGGKVHRKNNDEFYLADKNFKEPINISNLSAGLKSFVLLQMLLEGGAIKEKDVLILDEPEIHLHPEWQIVYAELIVLIQKQFDLSVVITSHSPYFIDAVNLYSIKHKTDHKVNYYLAKEEETQVTFEDVSQNIDELYKKMVTPVQALKTLRYEINNE